MTTGLNDPKITKDDAPVDGSGILAQFQSQVADFVNSTTFAITSADSVTDVFQVAGDRTSFFDWVAPVAGPSNGGTQFTVSGSAGNDGTYTVISPGPSFAAGFTTIPVTAVPVTTGASGNIIISKWATDGTNNFLSNYSLGGYYISSTSYGAPGPAPLKAGQSVSNEPEPSALTDAKVLASEVELALRNAVVALSNARKFRLRKYYYNAVYTLIAWADFGVQVGHLTDAYQAALPGSSLSPDTPISASGLDTRVDALDVILAAHRTATQNFNEYWCHSACHASHASRNRR